jgi:carbon monoxide dehydrogenase subunit G
MIDVTRTLTVPQRPETVVDYLRDFSRTEEWDPGTKTCTQTSTGPVQVGTTWHNVSEFAGRTTELEYRMEVDQPDHVVFRGQNKTASTMDDISVKPSGTGSEITYHATIEFHGVAKVATPFLKPGFDKVADKTVDQLTGALGKLPAG